MKNSAIFQKPVLILIGLVVLSCKSYLTAQEAQSIEGGIRGAANRSSKVQAQVQPESKWKLCWGDEFSGNELDTSKWTLCKRGRPAWRDTMSDDPRLLQIGDGVLRLRGIVNEKNEDDSSPFLTAGVTSKNKFSFQYGKAQIRARFNSAQGAWPALWMLGTKKVGKEKVKST